MNRYQSIAVAAALWTWLAAPSAHAADCGCLASVPPGSHVVLICPQGDGPTLAGAGAVITLTYTDLPDGQPLPGIGPAWSPGGCNGGIVWCGPNPTSDGLTDANGQTTASGPLAGGGYDTSMLWNMGGIPLPECWLQHAPITLVSPDINADLVVDIIDTAVFAMAYPPRPYDPRVDLNGDGAIGIVDLAEFAAHHGHRCP